MLKTEVNLLDWFNCRTDKEGKNWRTSKQINWDHPVWEEREKMKENEQHPRDTWGTIKFTNTCIMIVPEEEKGENMQKEI